MKISKITTPLKCELITKTNEYLIVLNLDTGERLQIEWNPILRDIFCSPILFGFEYATDDGNTKGGDHILITPYISTFHKGSKDKTPYWDYDVVELQRHEREANFIKKYRGKIG